MKSSLSLKALSEDAQYRAFTQGKIPMGVKEVGGRLLKGGVFSGTYSTSHITAQVFNCLATVYRNGWRRLILTMCVTNWKYVYQLITFVHL